MTSLSLRVTSAIPSMQSSTVPNMRFALLQRSVHATLYVSSLFCLKLEARHFLGATDRLQAITVISLRLEKLNGPPSFYTNAASRDVVLYLLVLALRPLSQLLLYFLFCTYANHTLYILKFFGSLDSSWTKYFQFRFFSDRPQSNQSAHKTSYYPNPSALHC